MAVVSGTAVERRRAVLNAVERACGVSEAMVTDAPELKSLAFRSDGSAIASAVLHAQPSSLKAARMLGV